MEYSSQVYKPDIWSSFPVKSFHHDTQKIKTIMDYLNPLIKRRAENRTRIFSEQKTITQSLTIENDEEIYVGFQDIADGIINPLYEAKKRIREIALLRENWNGHGAKCFSALLIKRVENIVNNLPVSPEIFPTAIGAIQIEYQKKDGSYLEFEIYENSANQYMIDKDGKEFEQTITNHLHINSDVVQAVVDFYE